MTSPSSDRRDALLVLIGDDELREQLRPALDGRCRALYPDSVAEARAAVEHEHAGAILIDGRFAGDASLARLVDDFPHLRALLVCEPPGRSHRIGDDVPTTSDPSIGAELFGMAVHDLRNPLSAIMGLSELILHDESFTPAEIRRFVRTISTNAGEIHRILDDLQEVTRIDRGMPLRISEVRLHPFLQDVTGVAIDREGNPLPVDLDLSDSPESWRFDRERVMRALQGMMTGTGSPARSTLAARVHDGMLELSLAQPDRRIDEEELRDLRDAFVRGRRRRLLDDPGTGLGLALAGRVAQAHGGSAEARLRTAGGLELVLRLPS